MLNVLNCDSAKKMTKLKAPNSSHIFYRLFMQTRTAVSFSFCAVSYTTTRKFIALKLNPKKKASSSMKVFLLLENKQGLSPSMTHIFMEILKAESEELKTGD